MALQTFHRCSPAGVKSELEFFTLPFTQTSHEGEQWLEFHPSSLKPQESDTVEFYIPNHGHNYLDPSGIYLQIKAKIVRADDANTVAITRTPPAYQMEGTPPELKFVPPKLSEGDKVYLCNNFANSMIRYCDIYLNQFLVSNHEIYAYRSYLDTVLNSTPAMRNAFWTMGFTMDDPGEKLDLEWDMGINKRYKLSAGSKEFNLETALFTDIGDTKMLLIPAVDMRIVIRQNPDSFRLMTTDDEERTYKLKITDFKLRVRFIKIADHERLKHEAALSVEPTVYALRGVDMKLRSLPVGSSDIIIENLCPARVPHKITIFFVLTDAFYGAFKKNPFKFEHLNMTRSSLFVGAHERREIFDFDSKQYAAAYVNFIRAINNRHVEISQELYEKQLFMLHYILSPDGCPNNFSPIQVENVRLQIQLKTPLTQSYTCVILSESPRVLEIYENRTLRLRHG